MKCSLIQSNMIVSESFWQIFTKLPGSLNLYGLRTIYYVTSLASVQFFLDYNKVGTAEYLFCLTTWGTSTGICSWTISKYYSREVHHITLLATSWGKKFILKDSSNIGKNSFWGKSMGYVKLLKGSLWSGVSNFRYRPLMRKQKKETWKYSKVQNYKLLRPEVWLSSFCMTVKEQSKKAENIIDLVSLLMRHADILRMQEFEHSTMNVFLPSVQIKLFRTYCTLYWNTRSSPSVQ